MVLRADGLDLVWLSLRETCGEHLKSILIEIKGWTKVDWKDILKRHNGDERRLIACANIKGLLLLEDNIGIKGCLIEENHDWDWTLDGDHNRLEVEVFEEDILAEMK